MPAIAQENRSQQNYRIPIAIEAKTDDLIGQSLVYNLKDQLSRSAVFAYSADSKKGFALRIISAATTQNFSAVAVVLKINATDASYYIGQWALIVSSNPTKMAQDVLAGLSEDMDILQKSVQQTPEEQSSVRSY